MRVLFVSLSEKSHLYCMTPLAWALTTAGHEVRVAATPLLTPTTTRAGLTAVPVGRDPDVHREMTAYRQTQDIETANWSQTEHDNVTWEALSFRYGISISYGIDAYNLPMLDDLVTYVRSWKPDLVIRDPLAYAGGIAARAGGAAHARLLWCADVWGRSRRTFLDMLPDAPEDERTDPLGDWLAMRGEPYGVTADEEVLNGQFTLDTMPPSLRLPTHLDVTDLRYIPYNGPAVVWDWLRREPERPRVCLTLGASNTEDYGGDYVSVPEILHALADLDVEVVAALATAEHHRLGTLPDNARVVDSVALNTLLPSCAAIIHHGGFGSYSTALAHGVPQLILSTSISDHELRGHGLQDAGAGVFVHWSKADAALVREQVRRMVDEPSFADAARRLRAEGAALPSPHEVVPELERRAAGR